MNYTFVNVDSKLLSSLENESGINYNNVCNLVKAEPTEDTIIYNLEERGLKELRFDYVASINSTRKWINRYLELLAQVSENNRKYIQAKKNVSDAISYLSSSVLINNPNGKEFVVRKLQRSFD